MFSCVLHHPLVLFIIFIFFIVIPVFLFGIYDNKLSFNNAVVIITTFMLVIFLHVNHFAICEILIERIVNTSLSFKDISKFLALPENNIRLMKGSKKSGESNRDEVVLFNDETSRILHISCQYCDEF